MIKRFFDIGVLRSIFFIEIKELISSRWFVFYVFIFLTLSIGFLFAGSGESQIAGFYGIGRFLASVVNLSFLLIPIFSLLPASLSISSSRENLSLEYILSFPVKKSEIFIAKFLSVLFVVFSAPFISFAVSLFFLRFDFSELITFLKIIFFVFLLSLSFVSLGFLISAFSNSRSKATSISLFLWFFFTLGSEIGILGFISVSKIPSPAFFLFVFLNPAETFRVASISLFSDSLDALGPFGIYIYSKLGNLFRTISSISIFLFSLIFLSISFFVFRRKRV